VKIVRKMKLKMAITLMAVSFIIIAMSTPVAATHPKTIVFLAMGDDLDIPDTTNLIIGNIKFGRGSELPTAHVLFHSKIYDESGEKVYAMNGMFKGELLTKEFYFYCPIFNFWWINVWYVEGMGKFKTTDCDIEVFFRKLFPITMPNTGGKYESAEFLMFLSPTAEYCLEDPGSYPPGTHPPVYIWPEGGWALTAVILEVETPIGPMVLPVGPLSYLTISIGI
jgi:hypothetical protein